MEGQEATCSWRPSIVATAHILLPKTQMLTTMRMPRIPPVEMAGLSTYFISDVEIAGLSTSFCITLPNFLTQGTQVH